MKSGLKVLLSAIVPMVALVSTSCGKAQTIGYDLALQYAAEHFDDNALDTVPTDYTFEVKKFGLDLNVNFVDTKGVSEDLKIAFGLDNIAVVVRDLYAYCMSSVLLSKIQSTYATISAFALEAISKIPVELTYQLENGGMLVRLGTNGVSNNFVDVLRLAVAGMSSVAALPESARRGIEDSLRNSFGKLGGYIVTAIEAMAMGLSISVDPTSTTINDKFEAIISSDSNGYITYADVNLGGDMNIALIVDTSGEVQQMLPGIDGRYAITGNIGMDFSATAEFTHK